MESVTGKPLGLFSLIVSFAVATIGCVIMVPTDFHETGSISESTLEGLASVTKSQVLAELGTPNHLFVLPDASESYYLYEGGKFADTFTAAFIPVSSGAGAPGTTTSMTTKTGKLCYLLTFDADEHMVRYEADSITVSNKHLSLKCTDGVVSRCEDTNIDCEEFFWSAEELSELIDVNLAFSPTDMAYITALALEGEPVAANELYERYFWRTQTHTEAWKWLCVEANKGNGKAQEQAGRRYYRSETEPPSPGEPQRAPEETGIRPDNRVAYMWYTLAFMFGNSDALQMRGTLAEDMTPAEIEQAEQMVRDWKPGDCPSSEYRLGPPAGMEASYGARIANTLASIRHSQPMAARNWQSTAASESRILIGLLPPRSGGSGSSDEIEGEVYKELRRYIESNRNFDLTFDYTVQYGAGSLDIYGVWRGNAVKKIPDRAKIQVIGDELGTDILVLTRIRADSYGGLNYIGLYVFDVANGKMYQGTDNFEQLKRLIESTFAQSGIPR